MLYILLATLSSDGQRRLFDNPELINNIANEITVPGAQLLARYAVLGRFDFVIIAETDGPESAARLSLEFGARAGVHIETLPAISVGLLAPTSRDDVLATSSLRDEPEESPSP